MALGLLASVNYSYFEYVGENFALLISSLLISRKFKGILASFLLLQLSYSYFLWWDATFAPKVAVEGLPSIISAYHSYFVYTSKLNGYLEQLTDYYWPLGQPGFIMPSYAPLSAVSVYGGLYRFTKYTCGCVSGCTPSRGREHREAVRGAKELFAPTRVWRGALTTATRIQGCGKPNT
jgi:hypothetical protein